jgi:hypothetical protein
MTGANACSRRCRYDWLYQSLILAGLAALIGCETPPSTEPAGTVTSKPEMARSNPVRWEAKWVPRGPSPNEPAQILIIARFAEGWHIGPLGNRQSSTAFELDPAGPLTVNGNPSEIQLPSDSFASTAQFTLPVRSKPNFHGRQHVRVRVHYQACDKESCLVPATTPIEFTFDPEQSPLKPPSVH